MPISWYGMQNYHHPNDSFGVRFIATIVRWFAPRNLLHGLFSFIFFSAVFAGVFWFVLSSLNLLQPNTTLLALATAVVIEAPFLILALFALRYQLTLQGLLAEMAATDSLTKLPNRRAFVAFSSDLLANRGGVLLMIDVDHFKRINDTYGHGFGDECLRQIAAALRSKMPEQYHLARIGGEEFGIMTAEDKAEYVEQIAARAAKGVQIVTPDRRNTVVMTMSIGVTHAHRQERLSDVMSRADAALYQAKEMGRARYVWASAPISAPALAKARTG